MTGNGAESARKAGYPDTSAIYNVASELIRKPHIVARIKELLFADLSPDLLEDTICKKLIDIITCDNKEYIKDDGEIDYKKYKESNSPGLVTVADKIKAAEKLAKIKKMFDDSPTNNNYIINNFSKIDDKL